MKCAAIKCTVETEHPDAAFCRVHWAVLSKILKENIVNEYQPGFASGKAKVSPEWRRAIGHAVRFLALKDGYPPTTLNESLPTDAGREDVVRNGGRDAN